MAELISVNRWLPVVASLCAGALVSLLVWGGFRLLPVMRNSQREFMDPLPLAFSLVWWPVQAIERFFEGFQTARYKARLNVQLRLAGLEYTLMPAQFVATRAIYAAALGLLPFLWRVVATVTGLETGGLRFTANPWSILIFSLLGWYLPWIWLKDRIKKRRREFVSALPFFLDIITLCIEAGLNFQGAMTQAVAKAPRGYLRDEFQRVLRDIRAGKPRSDALRDLSERVQDTAVSSFTTCVIQAERMGMTLAPMLRAQGEQRLNERFTRAERLSLEAPVKMLFPLIVCIFPCTFIVLLFPVFVRLMGMKL